MEAYLAAYKTWRGGLSPDDQARLSYLLSDGEPLFVDVIKAVLAKNLTGPFSGIETAVADALVQSVAEGVVKALQD